MKTFQVKIIKQSESEVIEKVLQNLQLRGFITFEETNPSESSEETTPATEEQVQEIIGESELAPFYSEKEAKDILNL
ncbi:hypothetical protein [Dyadobacter sp. CY323]|uniref:hypothetical protein n=1 Tax=Dyadobacter sp. CY323 TaxID=2907302 RepID=UPI001F1F0565|nr:hypothetical protein [Dyadobacter sp. CY323]MCE6992410.1 hypothetical protein [Dyadobacter sp. CY323]